MRWFSHEDKIHAQVFETKPRSAGTGLSCAGIFLYDNMGKIRRLKKRIADDRLVKSRSAFIMGGLVDVWSYFVFTIIVISFSILYMWQSTEREQVLRDQRDVTYGNYLAQVYLRTPLKVGTEQMTVAELISFYDYNQTLENANNRTVMEFIEERTSFVMGRRNPMQQALARITDAYVENNFDQDKCYIFSIHGNGFDQNRYSSGCRNIFSAYFLLASLRNIPTDVYVTHIASVNPLAEPISVISIYDVDRLVSIYAPDSYFDMSDARRWATEAMCRAPLYRDVHPDCRGRATQYASSGAQLGD